MKDTMWAVMCDTEGEGIVVAEVAGKEMPLVTTSPQIRDMFQHMLDTQEFLKIANCKLVTFKRVKE